MLKFFSKRMNNKKGFTLIELIVVIAILAILALIAIPRIGQFRTNAAVSTHNANVRTLESAVNLFIAQDGIPTASETTWSGTGGDSAGDSDEWGPYLSKWPNIPEGITFSDLPESEEYEIKITVTGDAGNEEVEVTVLPSQI